MGSKLGSIISLYIFLICSIFIIDLINIQTNYSSLDTLASSIGNIFSIKGGSNALEEAKSYLNSYSNTIEIIITKDETKVGEMIEFYLEKPISSLLFFNNIQTIKIYKTSIVGYFYGNFK